MGRRHMGRTNIDIDDELVTTVVRRDGLLSTRGGLDVVRRRPVSDAVNRDETLEMESAGWGDALDRARAGRTI